MKQLLLLTMTGFLAFAGNEKANENTVRLSAAQEVLKEALEAGDQSVPRDLIERAHCIAVVPGLKQGGFIVGAKYGKGYLLCRKEGGGWRGPAAVRIEGGSFGLQIGAGETDLVLLVMNASGRDKILANEFKIGGSAQVMAGPLGRSVQAETDLYMKAEMLGYSRSRGIFAGLALDGSTLREDLEDNNVLFGKSLSNVQIFSQQGATVPAMGKALVGQLNRVSSWEKK